MTTTMMIDLVKGIWKAKSAAYSPYYSCFCLREEFTKTVVRKSWRSSCRCGEWIFLTGAPSIYGCSVRNLLQDTMLEPRILRRLLDFISVNSSAPAPGSSVSQRRLELGEPRIKFLETCCYIKLSGGGVFEKPRQKLKKNRNCATIFHIPINFLPLCFNDILISTR